MPSPNTSRGSLAGDCDRCAPTRAARVHPAVAPRVVWCARTVVESRQVNKEAQRAELHRTIWRIANDLRGSLDGWDFKQYVLGILFYRFISENLAAYLDEHERKAGATGFNYASLSGPDAEFGRRETVAEKGFYILPSELFVNVRRRAKDDENLNETLARVSTNIEASAVGGRRRQRTRHEGTVRRSRREQRQARADGGEAQRTARQVARRSGRPAVR